MYIYIYTKHVNSYHIILLLKKYNLFKKLIKTFNILFKYQNDKPILGEFTLLRKCNRNVYNIKNKKKKKILFIYKVYAAKNKCFKSLCFFNFICILKIFLLLNWSNDIKTKNFINEQK